MRLSATSETVLGRALPFFVLAGAVLATFLIYGASRDFSFFLDDAFDLTRLEAQSAGEILFQPSSDYGYFRPVTFMLFKTNYELFGEHNTSALRTISLLLHAVSSWLLYLLVRRLTGSEWAIAAAALFLLFPFSYQTLNIIGATGHVIVAVLTLTALLCWAEGRYRASPALLIAAVLSASLAAWTMEYGVIALPLLAGLELYLRRRFDVPGRSDRLPLGLIVGLAIVQGIYLVIWFGMDRADTTSSGIEDIARNGTLWIQSAAYPGTRFLNIFIAGDEPLGYRAVLFASTAILSLALAIHAWLGQFRLALATIGIALVCFLPAMLMLTNEYVVDSPRLLYVSAPAIVTFWALLGRGLFADRRLSIAWQAAIALFVLVTLIHSYGMIERRIEMFRVSDSVVSAVVEAGDQNPETPVLLMNTPSWFAFHSMTDQEYPLWHLGVQGIPTYVGLDGLFYAATGNSADIESASLAPDVSGWDYAFGPHGPPVDHDHVNERIRQGYTLGIVSIIDDSAEVRFPGTLAPESAGDDPQGQLFDNSLALTQLDWQVANSALDVHTQWHVIEALEGDYQIGIDVRDNADTTVLEHRDYALSGMSPPRLWQPGDVITDNIRLALDPKITVADVSIYLINTGDGTILEPTGTGN